MILIAVLFLIPFVHSCSSGKVSVRFVRDVRSNPNREYFYVYADTQTANTPVFSQPRITTSYTIINYDVCLSPGSHAIKMTVTGQSGWASGSDVEIRVGSKTVGTYRLSSGTQSVKTFYISSEPSLSNVKYYDTTYALEKGIYYEFSPQNHQSGIKYSIDSGSLPSGMSLSASTGKISGKPTVVHDSSTPVNIKIYTSSSNSVTRRLTFRTFQDPTSCNNGRILISILRTTRSYAHEEYFQIRKESSFMYQQPSVMSSSSYSWALCLPVGTFELKLSDSGSDGWSSGSYVTLKNNDMEIGTYTLHSGTTDSYSFTVVKLEDLNKINYVSTSFKAVIGNYFNTSPRGDTNNVFYEISSGSLPNGFKLNKDTGAISGKCNDLVNSLHVSIKMYVTSNYYRIVNLQFSVLCASGYHTAYINRQTRSSSFQETFFIYEGKGTSGSKRFVQPDVIDNQSYKWFACLSDKIHTLEMIDSYGNGWSSGSYITITQNDNSQQYSLQSGYSELIYFNSKGQSITNTWIIIAIVAVAVVGLVIIICCCCRASNSSKRQELPVTKENKNKQPTKVTIKV